MSAPSYLVSVDPGLARLGWAGIDARGLRKATTLPQMLGRLLSYQSISSDPDASLPDRIGHLTGELIRHLAESGLPPGETLVVVELPNRGGGSYARQRVPFAAIAKGVAALHLSIGAIVCACVREGYRVEMRHPNSMSKKERWQLVQLAFGGAVRGRSNPEERDALWLGVQVLKDARRVWAPAPEGFVIVPPEPKRTTRARMPAVWQAPAPETVDEFADEDALFA